LYLKESFVTVDLVPFSGFSMSRTTGYFKPCWTWLTPRTPSWHPTTWRVWGWTLKGTDNS